MPTAIRIYNIFFWNSSLKEKPTELHWYAHADGWQQKPVMLKNKGANNFYQILKIKKCKHKKSTSPTYKES